MKTTAVTVVSFHQPSLSKEGQNLIKLKYINKKSALYFLDGLAFGVPPSTLLRVIDSALSGIDEKDRLPSRLIRDNEQRGLPSNPAPSLGFGVVLESTVSSNPQGKFQARCVVMKTDDPEWSQRPALLSILMQSPSLDIPMRVEVPLRYILKGLPDISGMYVVYSHLIARGGESNTLRQLYYGITKRGWNKRFSEHMRGALRDESRLLFPSQLREAIDARTTEIKGGLPETPPLRGVITSINAAGLDKDGAEDAEEYLVAKHSLAAAHPRNGLNMIPGGKAGLAALHALRAIPAGHTATLDTEERERILGKHLREHPRPGSPNEAIAQAWNDSAYAEAVICGRENRLSGEQVREIRYLTALGYPELDVLAKVGARSIDQVRRVVDGRTYARIH